MVHEDSAGKPTLATIGDTCCSETASATIRSATGTTLSNCSIDRSNISLKTNLLFPKTNVVMRFQPIEIREQQFGHRTG